MRGFAQAPPPDERPAQPPRQAIVDDSMPRHWPRDPVVTALLAEVDWDSVLAKRPLGWRMERSTDELRCPEGRTLTLTTVRAAEHATGRTGVIFRRPSGGCEECESRPDCLTSTRPLSPKHAEVVVPTSIAVPLRERLGYLRSVADRPTVIQSITAAPGPLAVTDALLLPATARQTFQACFASATLHVHVEMPACDRARPRLVAFDVAERQRRRKTWAGNVERHALPADAKVHVEVAGAVALRLFLGEQAAPGGAVVSARSGT